MFYRETHLPNVGLDRAALGTRDREKAGRLGKELYAALLTGKTAQEVMPAGPVALAELWKRYKSECPLFLDNKAHTKRDVGYRVPILLGFFGRQRDVRTLSALDLSRYTTARRAGGIRYEGKKRSKPVRQRTVHADLALLRGMLRWACTIPALPERFDGPRWLDRNPLEGMRFEREKNPVRPVATWERFQATRTTLQNLAANVESEEERERWIRLELALVLAEATGRRRGAIVALSWEDIDFAAGTIRWRAEYDKKGIECVIPVPPKLVDELSRFRRQLGALKGRVFPSRKHPGKPMPSDLLTQWLAAAEAKAKVPKLARGLWHPYRRKWASERMHLPLKAVADAGGWKDVSTLLTCYQQADDATLLEVMSESRKRSELRRDDLRVSSGAAG